MDGRVRLDEYPPVFIAAPVPRRMIVTSLAAFMHICEDHDQPSSVTKTVEWWLLNSTRQLFLEPAPEHVHGARWPDGYEPRGFDEHGRATLR